MSRFGTSLTMRAEIRRNTADTDGHGHPGLPGWELVKDGVPCFVWSKVRQRVVDQKLAEVEELGAIFRAGEDVLSFDRIEQIKDRRGRVLMPGPFEVLVSSEKAPGSGVDHQVVKLRRVA